MPPIALLGPQRHHPQLHEMVEQFGLKGYATVITAGWQERETEIEELSYHLGLEAVNLTLHRRGEQVFEADPELAKAHKHHQERMKRLQEIYRIRLNYMQGCVATLVRRESPFPDLLEPEVNDAFESLRYLDRHQLARIEELKAEFEYEWRPKARDEVQNHQREIAEMIDGSCAVLIAGGHVAVLLNRLRLFGLEDMIVNKPIIAWSAGAMVLSHRMVLFHDSPPQGRGFAEVFEAGLGLIPGIQPLPHAKKRLLLDDSNRVMTFARRFNTSTCLTFDDHSRILWDGDRWHGGCHVAQLLENGETKEVETL